MMQDEQAAPMPEPAATHPVMAELRANRGTYITVAVVIVIVTALMLWILF